MENYKPNSDKYRKEQQKETDKKVEKVVTGVVKAKKKSEVRRLADTFLADIWKDVLVPAIKKIITESIDTALYGQPRKSNTPTSGNASYNNYWKAGNNNNHQSNNYRSGGSYNYNDIVVDSRADAEEVLSRMDDLIATYEVVSVADLYDLVGITGRYTDNKYGWSDISSATVIRVSDGYLLKLPKALPLT